LLNVLAARVSDAGKSNASLSGEIFINGKIRHDDTFRRLSAYVLQVLFASCNQEFFFCFYHYYIARMIVSMHT